MFIVYQIKVKLNQSETNFVSAGPPNTKVETPYKNVNNF